MIALAAAALRFLKRLSPSAMIAVILAALLIVQTVRIEGLKIWPVSIPGLKAELAHAKADAANARNALAQTIANYRAAAAKAEADDKANAERVERQQAQISKEQSDEYQARLNAARADIARLRAQSRPANPGSPAKPDVPAIPTPTCGADSPALDPATRAFDCAIQLDELITWTQQQHAIDPNAAIQAKPAQPYSKDH